MRATLTEAVTLVQDKLEQLRATPFGKIPLNLTITDPTNGSMGITYTRSWVVSQTFSSTNTPTQLPLRLVGPIDISLI